MAAWHPADFKIVGHPIFPKRNTSTTKRLRYEQERAYLLATYNPKEPDYTMGDRTYGMNKLHPTRKPLPVLLLFVETFSVPQDTILDPFAGSGSLLLATKISGETSSASSLTPNTKL